MLEGRSDTNMFPGIPDIFPIILTPPPQPPLRHTLNIAKKIHPVHTKCAILSV